MHKEWFLNQRKSKLQPRGNGPFQVLERINDNAYKIDLLGECDVSATFNVADLTLFDTDFDSRSNPFEERGDDVDQPRNTSKDPLHVPNGPMTRYKTKAALMIITSKFFNFNVWEWFLCSSVLERTESDLSKINWLLGVILLNPVVLVPWGRFPLCHTPIRPISAFRDQISILIVGYVTTWSWGSH